MSEINNVSESSGPVFSYKWILGALKLVFALSVVGWFLYGIASTYAFVVYLQEDTIEEFMDGYFDMTGLGASDDTVTLLPIGITGDWVQDGESFPAYLTDLAAVVSDDRIFVLGGVDGTFTYRTEIYSATVKDITGTLSAWTKIGDLPVGLAGHQAVISETTEQTSTIYVIGGENDDDDDDDILSLNTVYRAVIDNQTGGLVGDVITNVYSLGDAEDYAVHYHSAVAHNGNVYVMGGLHLESGYDIVFQWTRYAPILENGVLGQFATTAELPVPLRSSAAVLYLGPTTDTIYLLGGTEELASEGETPVNKVFFGDIDLDTGAVITWTESISGNLAVPVWGHGGILANNGNAFVLGGRAGNLASPAVSSTVKSALVDDDDPAGIYNWCESEPCDRWQGQTGENLMYPRTGAASVLAESHIYVIGGESDTSSATNTVLRGGVGGIGSEQRHYYAPEGSYRSSAIDLDSPQPQNKNQLKGLSWRVYITGTDSMSLTLQYRYWDFGATPPVAWTSANPSQVSGEGGGYYVYTATIDSTESSTRYFQYQANMTTDIITSTPRLDWVRIYFDVPDPDVQVSKSGPDGVYPKETISYTVYYTATGGVPATQVVMTETVPDNTSYTSSPGWVLVGGDVYTYSLGTKGTEGPSVQSGSVTYQVTVDDEVPDAEFITNVVSIDFPPMIDYWGNVISDPVRSDNIFTDVMLVYQISWDIAKTAEPPSSIVVSSERPVITYTIRYTFTGNLTETGSVWITDVVDINYLEIITYSNPAQVERTGNTLVWTNDAEAVGPEQSEVVSFTAWVTRPVDNGTQFDNLASISSQHSSVETSEPVTHTVVSTPSLSFFKSVSPPSGSAVRPNSAIAYVLTVTNTGGMNATSAVISDTFDSEYLSNLSYSEGGTLVDSDTITWTTALLPVDTPWVVTFTAQVSNVTDVTITNQAEVDCTQRPVVQSNVVKHFVLAVPVLSIEKDDGRVEVAAGEVLTYQVSFANYGGMSATGVRITDTFPTSVVEPYGPNVGWNDCGDGCRYYDYAGTLSDTIQTISFTVQISQAAPLGPFTNHVSIGAEDNAIPDTSTDVDTVILQPNVTISKSDGRTEVNPGEYLTYTIQCDNTDSVDYSIVLTEVLPSEVRYVGYGWQLAGSDTYTRSLTVSSEGSETLLLFVQVDPGAAESTVLENTVTMYGGPYVSFPGGDHDTDTTTVNGLRDLTIYKTDGVGGVNPGQRITYTIVYTNDGNVTLPGVKITDTLTSGVTYTSTGSTCGWTGSHPQYVADIGSVLSGTMAQCTLVATVDGGASGFITNVVRIGGTEDEDNWVNNVFTDTDFVTAGSIADLYLVTITPVTPTVGSGTNFVVTVHNQGGEAQDITGLGMAEDEILVDSFLLPPPPPLGGGDMGAQVDCSAYEDYIYVGLYVDPYREPVGPADDWRDYNGYIELPIPVEESRQVVDTWYTGSGTTGYGRLSHEFTVPGWHHLAALVDVYFSTFDQCGWSPTFGHIPEADETNNLGTLDIWVETGSSSDGGIYLPIIMKNSS